jgi:hypothetical protein
VDHYRVAMYDFVAGLIAIVTASNGLWWIVGPFVIMGLILWFIRWARATAKGERMDDIRLDAEDSYVRGQTMMSQGYYDLHRQGYDARQIAYLRNQQPGAPLPSRETLRRVSGRRQRIR